MNTLNKTTVKIILIAVLIIFVLNISTPGMPMFDIPPHIRDFVWLIFIAAGAVLLYLYLQPGIKPHPPKPELTEYAEGYTRQGSVLEYGSNRIGDIDKLLFQANQEKVWLHFPPHTAKQVMNIAAKGAAINVVVRVTNRKAADDLPLYDLIAVQTSATTLQVDEIKPPPPTSGKQVEISGTVAQYKLDEQGLISGFIIDKYIIDIPPHFAQTIVPLIKQAKEISVKGYERSLDEGFVNFTGFVLIKPYAITIDKTDYLL